MKTGIITAIISIITFVAGICVGVFLLTACQFPSGVREKVEGRVVEEPQGDLRAVKRAVKKKFCDAKFQFEWASTRIWFGPNPTPKKQKDYSEAKFDLLEYLSEEEIKGFTCPASISPSGKVTIN